MRSADADVRPDPDELLARVRAEEVKSKRGKLKIFFGATAGVGKTYAMLEAAQRRKAEGLDVVVGYVEPHGRIETERLLDGLAQLPQRNVTYRGTARREFDLDAALTRKPQLILVDELAHSNLVESHPKPRHDKRWQDVEELLDAGIDVYTTVNVQHLESLNDIVAQITGIRQQETLPDRVFDLADEVELVDLPPDELLQRLREGKVYVPAQARFASENFFRKGNLIALRELALRKTADRVDQAMREYREREAVTRPWAVGERLLVCVGPDAQAEKLVRAGKRLADGLNAPWIVVYVETPNLLRLSQEERNRRIDVLRLAESLGGETVTLGGSSAADELLQYARTRNVTRILIGKPNRRKWPWKKSTVTDMIARSGDFDIVVVGLDDAAILRRSPFFARTQAAWAPPSAKPRWPGYAAAAAAAIAATALCFLMFPAFELANLVMVYLLAAAAVAVKYGRGPAIAVSLLNVAAFDFFFVPPRFSFAVSDIQYLVTFAIMLGVALVIVNLNASVRLQARVAGHRERRTARLYEMTRELSVTRGQEEMSRVAVKHVCDVFDCQAVVLLPNAGKRITYPKSPRLPGSYAGAELGIVQWVHDHGKPAGLGTDTLAGSDALYLPLIGTERTLGVLAVLPANVRRVLLPEQRHLLETFAGQIAVALERAVLAERAQASRVEAETEGLRNSLLASISHDLRTPLSVIVGASGTLAEQSLSDSEKKSLAKAVHEQARHVSDVVTGVLDLVRLESGAPQLKLDWYALDEIIGTVLHRLDERLRGRNVILSFGEALPLVQVDGKLIEQLIENLVENAARHGGSEIRISAEARAAEIEVAVEDDGPGLRGTDPEQLFLKFQRGRKESAIPGIGLGLAICRAIVRLHGGRIWASERKPRGAVFRFTLPIGEASRLDSSEEP